MYEINSLWSYYYKRKKLSLVNEKYFIYRKGLLPSFINKKKRIRILNISCEAHRDVCMYLLRKNV